MVLNWQADFKTWSADRVERAYTDDYELVVLSPIRSLQARA